MKKTIIIITVMLTMVGCVKEEAEKSVVESRGVSAIVSNFVNQDTKTIISQSGTNPPVFQWKIGDVIGVVPSDGRTFQTNYAVDEIGQDPHNAHFDGGAWTLKEGYKYYAYFPCTEEVVTSDRSVTLSVTGQSQNGNSSLAHLGDYDFLYAGETGIENGSVTFGFSHMISLIRIQIKITTAATFTTATLSVNGGAFVTEAELSIADGTISPHSTSSTMELGLDNVSVEAGDTLTLWLAMLPTTAIKEKDLMLTLTSASGSDAEYSLGKGFELAKGKAYSISGVMNPDVFKNLSTLGFYTATNTAEPFIRLGVDSANGQYSCHKTSSGYVFRIFNSDLSGASEISIPSKQFTVGDTLSVTETVYGATASTSSKTVTVIRKVGNIVTLEDKTGHSGYIINIE